MKVGCGIYHATILIDFKVNVGRSRATGWTNERDDLAFLNHITRFYQIDFVVCVTSLETRTVTNLNQIPIIIG